MEKRQGLLAQKPFLGWVLDFEQKMERKWLLSKKKHDPTARLKQLAQVATPKKKMEGGLHPVLIPILASLAGTALGKVWDLVKEKNER